MSDSSWVNLGFLKDYNLGRLYFSRVLMNMQSVHTSLNLSKAPNLVAPFSRCNAIYGGTNLCVKDALYNSVPSCTGR